MLGRSEQKKSQSFLGLLKIADKKLVVEVNSNKRTSIIQKQVLSRCGASICFKTKVIESIEDNIELIQKQRLETGSAVLPAELSEEVQEPIKETTKSN